MSRDDESNDDLANLIGYEGQLSFSKENVKLIRQMMKLYKFNPDQLTESMEQADEPLAKSDISVAFSQDRRINSWKKFCKDDGDCLADFFNLFLEQRSELSRRVTRDLLAMI